MFVEIMCKLKSLRLSYNSSMKSKKANNWRGGYFNWMKITAIKS